MKCNLFKTFKDYQRTNKQNYYWLCKDIFKIHMMMKTALNYNYTIK